MIKPYESDLQACLQVFSQHGVILYPTDTIWGLGCPVDDEEAIERIIALKKRPAHKSFIVLMTDIRQLLQYVAAPPHNLEEILSQFSSPTTLIYDQAIHMPNSILHADGSVGIRITQDPFCRSLIKRCKKPIISTSANISGEPSPTQFQSIDAHIKMGADYTVQYRQHENPSGQVSAIYKILSDGNLQKIR